MSFWKKSSAINLFERPKGLFLMDNESTYMEFYLNNPIVFRAVSIYIKHIISVEIEFPQEISHWHSFIIDVVQKLLITGNAFIDKSFNVISKSSSVNRKEGILHLKLNEIGGYGISPIRVAKKAIEAHDEVSKFIMGIIQNGGKPSGILSHKDVYESSFNIQQKVQDLYAHINKVGSFALLEGEYEWKQIGISPEKLELLHHKAQFEKEIAIAFDIPPAILGIVEASYSNYREARIHFMETSIIPMLNYILQQLNSYAKLDLKIKEA